MALTVLFCVFQGCSFISVKAPWGHIRLFVKGGGEDFIFVQNYKLFVNFEVLLLTDKNEVFPQCKHHFSQPYDIFCPSSEGKIHISIPPPIKQAIRISIFEKSIGKVSTNPDTALRWWNYWNIKQLPEVKRLFSHFPSALWAVTEQVYYLCAVNLITIL